MCGNARYNTQLCCLAVQAGFYSDMVVLALDVSGLGFDLRLGQKVISVLSPTWITFGAQRKITHPMAPSTSMSKIGSLNVKLKFGFNPVRAKGD